LGVNTLTELMGLGLWQTCWVHLCDTVSPPQGEPVLLSSWNLPGAKLRVGVSSPTPASGPCFWNHRVPCCYPRLPRAFEVDVAVPVERAIRSKRRRSRSRGWLQEGWWLFTSVNLYSFEKLQYFSPLTSRALDGLSVVIFSELKAINVSCFHLLSVLEELTFPRALPVCCEWHLWRSPWTCGDVLMQVTACGFWDPPAFPVIFRNKLSLRRSAPLYVNTVWGTCGLRCAFNCPSGTHQRLAKSLEHRA
jgi:hypothetical protein